MTKENLLGNMVASHNQSLNTSVNPRQPIMGNTQMNIKSPKTNIQGMPINKNNTALIYQQARPHSQNKDFNQKNGGRTSQHETSAGVKDKHFALM